MALYLSSRLSQAASKSVVELAHAAIVWLHELFGISPNPARSGICRAIPEAARRLVPAGRRQKQAITLSELHSVLSRLLTPEVTVELSALHLRTAALLSLMFHGFLRISETLALRCSDVEWGKTHIVLNVLYSKGNVYREARKVPISVLRGPYCPVSLLHRLLKSIRLSEFPVDTPLFPRLRRVPGDRYVPLGSPISASTARSLIGDAFVLVGLDRHLYSSHSLRAGGASQALAKGFLVERVVWQGRWASYSAFAQYWDQDLDTRADVSALRPTL
ncbi:MAG: tyrosine-type recombinase/integrase [Gammaproteobacteria bacterium]|nr:tyrosine-type recombinase/integrase [Gammaproteobacteria bacterium]